jgi:hypothetical protein
MHECELVDLVPSASTVFEFTGNLRQEKTFGLLLSTTWIKICKMTELI